MDDRLQVVIAMHRAMWDLLKNALGDLDEEEIDWRPLPQANNIDVIVRHLRIEAAWHLDSLKEGAVMPFESTPAIQAAIDAVPFDFHRNLGELEKLYAAFVALLESSTVESVGRRTAEAYGAAAAAPERAHLLAYHQVLHVATHCGQIRTIRNLYRKTRGEPARFFPENPTYPRQ